MIHCKVYLILQNTDDGVLGQDKTIQTKAPSNQWESGEIEWNHTRYALSLFNRYRKTVWETWRHDPPHTDDLQVLINTGCTHLNETSIFIHCACRPIRLLICTTCMLYRSFSIPTCWWLLEGQLSLVCSFHTRYNVYRNFFWSLDWWFVSSH